MRSVGRIITSVDHDCCPKNARLKMKITHPTAGIDGTSITHGISAALAPSATLRATLTDAPRRSSWLDNAPPQNDPTPDAAYGIHPMVPAVLISNWKLSKRNFGSQNK